MAFVQWIISSLKPTSAILTFGRSPKSLFGSTSVGHAQRRKFRTWRTWQANIQKLLRNLSGVGQCGTEDLKNSTIGVNLQCSKAAGLIGIQTPCGRDTSHEPIDRYGNRKDPREREKEKGTPAKPSNERSYPCGFGIQALLAIFPRLGLCPPDVSPMVGSRLILGFWGLVELGIETKKETSWPPDLL
jgi:hypothetical protein